MNNTDNKQKESTTDQLFDWLRTITIDLPDYQTKMEEAIIQKGKENGSNECVQDTLSD
tara:strand:+ start:4026 stop:4199 length:174 start_codon:yes stop_codon:yes gene_type:complete